MVFSSTVFIFVFLPIFLLIYYAIPRRWQSAYILVGSYSFYAWWRIDFLAVLMGVTLWNYAIGHYVHTALAQSKISMFTNHHKKMALRWLHVGVVGNLCTLGYFKYFNFGVDSFNGLMGQFGVASWQGWDVILPIGISFFTFQSISYLIDVYREDAKPAHSLVNFAAFIALFPQLIAGPVLRYKDLEQQFHHRTHTREKLQEGLERFTIGLAKKVIIADSAATIADPIFALSQPTMLEAWLGVLAYTVQLYFDFSGYSCMAIGLGLMMGFRFIENFNAPYTSRSITEFWQRWHISLSTWLRDYLYVPLGGNRQGNAKTYRNLALTMILGGLWHGAGWTFVLWGVWHGGLLAIERTLKQAGLPYRFPALFGVAFTMVLVMIGWTLFRAIDLQNAMAMFSGMFGLQGFAITPAVQWQLSSSGLLAVGVGLLLVYGRSILRHLQQDYWQPWRSWLTVPACCSAILLVTAKLSADSYSPFLYFQF